MRFAASLKVTAAVLGVLFVVSSGAQVFGQGAAGGTNPPLVDAKNLRMQPEDVLPGTFRIFGEQGKDGFYAYRNHFKPGQMSRPHFHDKDRWIMVIKGTWWTGEGDVFRADSMIPVKEGGFMYHPANYHHYDGSKEGDVIVQIMGWGPATTTRTEVDEKGNPINRQ